MAIIANFISVYLVPLLVILIVYLYVLKKNDQKIRVLQKEQVEAGLSEPVSLHPSIDPAKCIGCSACVDACPEQDVLGIVDGKSALVTPANCIGHGACRVACPVDAITLVFGTEKRGVDIPLVNPNFETNIPGIFIAGELGGMGLIRNAVEQGAQAMEAVGVRIRKNGKIPGVHDVVIVGAGPAGFSASLSAIEQKLDYVTLEQETLGGTVSHYPRGKIVMTKPVVLPIVGETHFKEIGKEQLLKFWQDTEKAHGVRINYSERVEKVGIENGVIVVVTQKNVYKTQNVLLAIGRRGTPRKLGVPGEEKTKVVYRLIDPVQYQSQNVLVVGGGDSALEAALALSEVANTTVTLSYRAEAFGRVKPKNREQLQQAQGQGRVNVLLNSNVKEIFDGNVILDQAGKKIEIKNDAVIICAGGVLPTPFLKDIGVRIETKYGKA
jgi:thioredoxin reductase/ferredoxin